MLWYREDEVNKLIKEAYRVGYEDNELHKKMVDEAYVRGRAVGFNLGRKTRISFDMRRQKMEAEMLERKEFVGDCIYPDGGKHGKVTI